MTHAEIMTKAIEKSQRNGWNTDGNLVLNYTMNKVLTEWDSLLGTAYFQIVFRSDFAKAFWPLYKRHKLDDATTGVSRILDDWQYHLQQMVIAEDPIKYLEKFI